MKKGTFLLLLVFLISFNTKSFTQCSDANSIWYDPSSFPPTTPASNSTSATLFYPLNLMTMATGSLTLSAASMNSNPFSNSTSSYIKNAFATATIVFNTPVSKTSIESFKISNVSSIKGQVVSGQDINGSYVELVWLNSSIKDVSATTDPAFINNEIVGNNPPFSGSAEFSFKSAIKTLTISRKTSVTSTGDVTITFQKICINTPTPVELTFFKAKASNNTVKLNWQTASEKNNKGFEIFRSVDLKTWENIGGVKGQGESNLIVNYNFEDKHPLSILTYYRLKQVDFDEKESYSNIESVSLDKKKISFEIYPNPIKNKEATIILNEDLMEGTLSIINSVGLVVKREKISDKNFSFDLHNLTTGIYIFNIQKDNNFISKKVMVAE